MLLNLVSHKKEKKMDLPFHFVYKKLTAVIVYTVDTNVKYNKSKVYLKLRSICFSSVGIIYTTPVR